MKITRFLKSNNVQWGIIEKNKIFSLDGNPYDEISRGKEIFRLEDIKLLAPAEPSIMVCCGMNYAARLKESGWTPPQEPIVFFKPPSAMIGNLDNVVFPSIAQTLRYEAELCVIMKRRTKNVSEKDAMNYVLGFTCGNELGAMDLLKIDKWMTRAKGFDTSGALGPWLETDLDPHNLRIKSWVNGQIKQDSNTNLMNFNVNKLISFISTFMTLNPGDVIWTGTPEGACDVKVGDIMDIEIEGIGTLRNQVVAPI